MQRDMSVNRDVVAALDQDAGTAQEAEEQGAPSSTRGQLGHWVGLNCIAI